MSALMPIDVRNPVHIAEAAANFIYEIKLRIYAVQNVLHANASSFNESKDDCMAYQLDDIYDLLTRELAVFNDAVESALKIHAASVRQAAATSQAVAITDDEAELLADFRAANKVSQNFSLVQSHFLAEKPCNETMRTCLSMLAFLCVNATADAPKSCGELLPEESGKGVLNEGKGKDAATPPGVVK